MTTHSKPFVLFHNGGVGDFLMFIFLSQQLYDSGAASRITIVVPRAGGFLRGLIAEYPYITLVEASRRNWRAFFSLLSYAPSTMGVVVHPTVGRIPLRLKVLAWCMTRARGSVLLGFTDQGPLCQALYTTLLPYDTQLNYADLMRRTAAALGAAPDPNPPRLSLPHAASTLESRGLAGNPYAVLHPGAGMSLRKRSFDDPEVVELVSALLSMHAELVVVLSGGPEEREWIEELARRIGSARVQTAIALPAAELGTLIAGAKLYLGGDTGVTHLACFVGARVLEVAHNATAHWLCFYCPTATVLYCLQGESEARTSEAYITQKAPGVLRPFTSVPLEAAQEHAGRLLASDMIDQR